jgi:Fe-S cluster assembly protein SufD
MKVINTKDLRLPKKKEEEFLKINFDPLFSYDFKNVETLELDIMGLEEVVDETTYASPLFDITRNFDVKQKVLKINKNIKEPIFLIHKISEDETFFTNSIKIEVSQGIKAQVVELFITNGQNSALSINRNIHLEKDANFEYVKIQDISSSNSMLFNSLVSQDENSNLDFSNFEYGDGFIVNTIQNIIEKQSVTYNLNGLVKLNNDANCANLIKTIHNEKESLSNINYKHSLKESSKAVFKATSVVNESAPNSKAFQNSDTILLSDDATIYAQPHLEIFIDELEASHGATTGSLNKEQLLYLQSRGISKDNAYNMLLEAFEKDIAQNLKNELVKEFVLQYDRRKYV